MAASSLVPQILVHFAPNDDVTSQPEPQSPCVLPDDDSPRSPHLMPPPTMSPTTRLSPLRPAESLSQAKGLDRSRFESLLQATRERSAHLGKKPVDLRKEVALKAHKSKQEERRAVFLSKIQSPPSPTATVTPVTPPESPAVFHFTLPSPGLISPLALFEAIGTTERSVRVEHIDFRQQAKKSSPRKSPTALPSLDQISARLGANAARADSPPGEAPAKASRPGRAPIPLPAFLTSPGHGRPQSHASQPAAAPCQPPYSAPAPSPAASSTTTIRARPVASKARAPAAAVSVTARSTRAQAMLERLSRRISIPPEMSRPAFGMGEVFSRHRMLLVPGGF